MPSKLTSTSSRSRMFATMGCVEGSWSWRYAQDFSSELKVTQLFFHFVTSAVARVETYSAKDSLSHRSFHHFMVTRSPNHMWASSCSTVVVRRSTRACGGLLRKM